MQWNSLLHLTFSQKPNSNSKHMKTSSPILNNQKKQLSGHRFTPSSFFGILLCLALLALLPARLHAQINYDTVNMSSEANFTYAGEVSVPGDITGIYLPGAPTGMVTLGGVPFNLASNASGFQAWSSQVAADGGSGEVSVTVPVGVYGVTNVNTLINTMWGDSPPGYDAWVVFTGSGGATLTYDLVGNTNVRNWIPGGTGGPGTTSTIVAPTVEVYSGPSYYNGFTGVLDMQDITLPTAFADQTLTSIELVDDGNDRVSRTVLDGITVEAVPEPTPAILLFAGLFVFLACRARRNTRGVL